MAQAKITINSVPGSNLNLPINALVALDNQNTGGELTFTWSILDQPPGVVDALSSVSAQNPFLTPKKEGTYLLRLIVNQSLPTEQEDRVVIGIQQLKTLERIPAAGETTEGDTSDGWATSQNSYLRRIDALLTDPGIIVGVNESGGTLTRGQVVRCSAASIIKVGLPGQETLPGFSLAHANLLPEIDELLAVVEGAPDGSTSIPGVGAPEVRLMKVRYIGRFAALTPGGTAAVGDTVYLDDAGSMSLTSGTIRRRVGSAMTAGTTFDVWFNGVGGADIDLTPIDRAYLVYGNPGTLPNAKRVDGTSATGGVGGISYRFRAGDLTTVALQAQAFAGSGLNIFQVLDPSGAVLAAVGSAGGILSVSDITSTLGAVLTSSLGSAGRHGVGPDYSLQAISAAQFDLKGPTAFGTIARWDNAGNFSIFSAATGSTVLKFSATGTDAFAGTVNNVRLVLFTNNLDRWRVETNGDFSATVDGGALLTSKLGSPGRHGIGPDYAFLETSATQFDLIGPATQGLRVRWNNAGEMLSYSSAGSVILRMVADEGGNTALLGTVSASDLYFATSNVAKWRITVAGTLISVGGPRPIESVSDPVNPQDAATKNYVDSTKTPQNFVINGAFDFFQRTAAAVPIANGSRAYNADRWYAYHDGAIGPNAEQSKFLVLGQPTLMAARVVGETSASKRKVVQEIDRDFIPKLRGRLVQLSVGLIMDTGFTGTVNVKLVSGTGVISERIFPSTSESYTTGSSTLITQTVSTTQTVLGTATIPSGATTLAVVITHTPSGTALANDNFKITEVQLLEGSPGLPGRYYRSGGTTVGELRLCQRFYEKSVPLDTPFDSGSAFGDAGAHLTFFNDGNASVDPLVNNAPIVLGAHPKFAVPKTSQAGTGSAAVRGAFTTTLGVWSFGPKSGAAGEEVPVAGTLYSAGSEFAGLEIRAVGATNVAANNSLVHGHWRVDVDF